MSIVARKKIRGRRCGAPGGRATPSARLLSFAALAVLVVGLALWFWLHKSASVGEPSAPPRVVTVDESPALPEPSTDKMPAPRVEPPPAPLTKTVAPDAAEVAAPISAPAATTLAEVADEPPVESPPGDPDNPDLAVGFGQALSMLNSVELGDDPPPFPHFYAEDEDGNEDFFVSESNVIVIAETDSPVAERRKEAIAWAKVDIGEYVRQGGRASDALEDIHAYQKECANLRIDASDDFRAWLTEHPEEEDEVLTALEEFNAKLREEGIKELSVEEIKPFEDE